MFNLKRDGWKGAVDPTMCDHERCYNACDLDWTTRCQVDGQGQLEKTSEGQRKDSEPSEVWRLLWPRRLAAPERRTAYLIWSPTLARNYTCAYCGCAAGEKRIRYRLSLLVPRADRRRVDRHLERHPGALPVRRPQHHQRRAAAQRSDDPGAQLGDAEVRLLRHLQHQPQHHGVHPQPDPPGGLAFCRGRLRPGADRTVWD